MGQKIVKATLDYDPQYDTLRIAYASGKNSYGDDSIPGLICLRDLDTDKITGVTVMHFLNLFQRSELPKLPDNVFVDFNQIADTIYHSRNRTKIHIYTPRRYIS